MGTRIEGRNIVIRSFGISASLIVPIGINNKGRVSFSMQKQPALPNQVPRKNKRHQRRRGLEVEATGEKGDDTETHANPDG